MGNIMWFVRVRTTIYCVGMWVQTPTHIPTLLSADCGNCFGRLLRVSTRYRHFCAHSHVAEHGFSRAKKARDISSELWHVRPGQSVDASRREAGVSHVRRGTRLLYRYPSIGSAPLAHCACLCRAPGLKSADQPSVAHSGPCRPQYLVFFSVVTTTYSQRIVCVVKVSCSQ